jgi:hypothetical protein
VNISETTHTEQDGAVVTLYTSMQEAALFEYRSRRRLCWLKYLVVFVHCFQANFVRVPRLVHNHFFINPFRFIIYQSPRHSTLHSLNCWQYYEINICNRYIKHTNSKHTEILFHLKSSLLIHRITGFLDFFHRPVFLEVETRRFGSWICFRPLVKDGRRHLLTLVGPLRKS